MAAEQKMVTKCLNCVHVFDCYRGFSICYFISLSTVSRCCHSYIILSGFVWKINGEKAKSVGKCVPIFANNLLLSCSWLSCDESTRETTTTRCCFVWLAMSRKWSTTAPSRSFGRMLFECNWQKKNGKFANKNQKILRADFFSCSLFINVAIVSFFMFFASVNKQRMEKRKEKTSAKIRLTLDVLVFQFRPTHLNRFKRAIEPFAKENGTNKIWTQSQTSKPKERKERKEERN